MIHLKCLACGKKLVILDSLAGRKIACPKCKNKFRVPEQTGDEAAEEEAAASPPERPVKSKRPRPPSADKDDLPVPPSWGDALRGLEEGEEAAESDEDADNADASENEQEDEPSRPARKRMKRRRGRQSSLFEGMLPPFSNALRILRVLGVVALFGALGVCVWLVFDHALAAALAPKAWGVVAVGLLMYLAGHGWFLIGAARAGPGHVLLVLICVFMPLFSPFIYLYYLVTCFGQSKGPFLLWLTGVCLLCAGAYLTTRYDQDLLARPTAPPANPFVGITRGTPEADVLARLGPPAEVKIEPGGEKDMKWFVGGQELDVFVNDGKVQGLSTLRHP